MRIVYADPLKELTALLQEAEKAGGVSHVAISKAEMQLCITHMDAAKVFPNYVNERQNSIAQHQQNLSNVQAKLRGNTLMPNEVGAFHDRQYGLQEEIRRIESNVPTEVLAFNGILVKASLTA